MIRFFSIFFLILVLTLSLRTVWAASEEPMKNVLILNSYHDGYAWSDTILKGIRSGFEKSGKNVYLQIEYMDMKRYDSQQNYEILYNYYKYKFKSTHFNVILVSDNNAYDFVNAYGEELFPGTPIVFCGVNYVKVEDVPFRHKMTGVLEEFDVLYNINLALRFHPGKKRLVVIGDRSVTGIAIANQVRERVPDLPKGMRVEFLDDFSIDELLQKVRDMAEDSIFFFIPLYKDVGESVFSAQEIQNIVWEKTHVPLYGGWDFLLGHGLVGGKLASGFAHGWASAEMGLRILNGTSPADIPVTVSTDDPPTFDYKVLTRLGIPQKLLPEGSRLINEPPSFYSIDRRQFWTIIVSMIVLSLVLVLLVMNILERKQIELRIKDQLSFMRTLMDTLPIPLYFTNKAGAISGINKAFEQWFGQDWSTEAAQSGDRETRGILAALLEKRLESYESIIRHADGSERAAVLHKAEYADAQGQQAGIVGVIYDISDRKKAEDDLRAAEEKYRSIFENSALGIFRTTPDGSWLDANPALARMLEYMSAEEMITRNPNITSLYVYEDDRLRVVELYRESGGRLEVEVPFKTKSGKQITVNLNARAVRGPGGEFCHFEGFVEDISDRKAAEQALAASEGMLQLVLNTIPQLVHWKDRDMCVLGANRNFLAHIGVSELNAIIGKTYEEFAVDPVWVDEIVTQDREVMMTDTPKFRIRRETCNAAGEQMWLLINKVPLHDPQGAVVGVLITAEDITQTINLEKQLVQSQKMEAIGTLAGGIAHDFNNILTSIMNSTELAMEDIPEESLVWKDLERCLKAATRGSGLIKQILTFSRPTQEGFMPTDLREVVSEAVALIKVSLPRNIAVQASIDENLGHCLADPTQVHQIVMNLVTNSFQAMRERGGTIRISLGQVMLDTADSVLGGHEPGCYTRLLIQDDGPGIDEDIQDKIFDPFFTTKDKGEGTGLGLAVVHGIVRNHNGIVRVQSAPQATSFEIYLPTLNDMCLLPSQFVAHASEGSEHIIFIEDDEDQLLVVPRVLEQLGYAVQAFQNPVDAVHAVCEQNLLVDLVVTDFDMPGMNGFEVAEYLAGHGRNVPVILVSGRKRAAELFATSNNIKFFLSKPYNKDMLGRAIRDVLDKDISWPRSS